MLYCFQDFDMLYWIYRRAVLRIRRKDKVIFYEEDEINKMYLGGIAGGAGYVSWYSGNGSKSTE